MSSTSAATFRSNISREEAFMEILAQLHRRWRFATCLPVVYMAGGLLLAHYVLHPHFGGRGFLPIPSEIEAAALFVGGAVVVLLHRLLVTLQRIHLSKLAADAHSPSRFLERARSQQYLEFAICDFACAPGVTLFLLQGTMIPMVIFLLISMFFYLTILPSERKLGEAMFRPEKLAPIAE